MSEQRKADTGKVNLSFVNCTSLFALAFTHKSKIYVAEGMSKITIKKDNIGLQFIKKLFLGGFQTDLCRDIKLSIS